MSDADTLLRPKRCVYQKYMMIPLEYLTQDMTVLVCCANEDATERIEEFLMPSWTMKQYRISPTR
jgi:hypothetical protein